jgi:hypothetical protein
MHKGQRLVLENGEKVLLSIEMMLRLRISISMYAAKETKGKEVALKIHVLLKNIHTGFYTTFQCSFLMRHTLIRFVI